MRNRLCCLLLQFGARFAAQGPIKHEVHVREAGMHYCIPLDCLQTALQPVLPTAHQTRERILVRRSIPKTARFVSWNTPWLSTWSRLNQSSFMTLLCELAAVLRPLCPR